MADLTNTREKEIQVTDIVVAFEYHIDSCITVCYNI